MASPLVAVLCVGVAIVGLVVFLQAVVGRDLPSRPYQFDSDNEPYDVDNRGRTPDQHRWRAAAIGGGLVLVGVAGVVTWGAVFY
jgi:hypothetical protein